MKNTFGFKPWLKGVLFWVTFMLLYGLQKLAPVFPVTLFTAIDESNFQHYKATFIAYFIISLVEFIVFRKNLTEKTSFWYSRLTTTIFIPWLVFLGWYLMPAILGGKALPNVVLEILFANCVALTVGIVAANLERGFATMIFSKWIKVSVWIFFIISIVIYTLFTFYLPWADVFTEPNWRETSLIIWRFHV
jgi:hypothetical protein